MTGAASNGEVVPDLDLITAGAGRIPKVKSSSPIAASPVNSFQELNDSVLTPESLGASLAGIGLKVKNVRLQPLKVALDTKFAQPLSEEESLMALGSLGASISQALGTTYIIELQKIMDKNKADNTSLVLGVSALINFTLANPDVAIVSWGSEGPRDKSWGVPEWTIIYRGKIYRNRSKTKEEFESTLQRLKAENPALKVLYLFDDALEVTNAAVNKRIGEDPNSWAVTALFTRRGEKPESDKFWRIVGISYHAPKQLDITPFTTPREFYPKLAQAYGISPDDKEAFAKFMSGQLGVVLYMSSFDKEARVNHELIYKEGKQLEQEYPTFKFLGPGDGDLDKRIFSITGQPIDGRNVSVFGRSGSIEGAIANGVASFTPDGYFVNTRVSPTATAKILSVDTAHNLTPEELEEAERLGYSREDLIEIRTGKEIKGGTGVVALTVVNDALEGQFGKDKDFYKGVNVEGRESQTPTFLLRTSLTTSKGQVLVEAQLESDIASLGNNIDSVYAEIERHVATASSPIEGINKRIKELERDIAERQNRIEEIQADTTNNAKEIEELRRQLSDPAISSFSSVRDDIRELKKQQENNLAAILRIREHIGQMVSELRELRDKAAGASSPLVNAPQEQTPNAVGGIDFRLIPIITQPMRNLSGLNFSLPKLSNVKNINLDEELEQIQNMLKAGITPSGERLKEYVAACYQKGELNLHMDEIVAFLVDTCKLEEEKVDVSANELKEVMLILDSIG